MKLGCDVGQMAGTSLPNGPTPAGATPKVDEDIVQPGGETRPLRRGERMHPKRTARRLMPWAIVLTIGLVATVNSGQAQPDPKAAPPVKVDAKTGVLIVPLGGTVTFEPKRPEDTANRYCDCE